MRGSSRPDPQAVIATVRARLGWLPLPDPDSHPAEALTLNPFADLDATRRVLRHLYG